jgi:hypothetical protein
MRYFTIEAMTTMRRRTTSAPGMIRRRYLGFTGSV